MKIHTNTKGFTLIELLVVVAIIGILATVVLSSLGTARDRAKDASVKATLSQMRAQAELQYDGDYSNVCDPTSKSGIMFRDAVATSSYVYQSNIYAICVNQGEAYNSTNGGVSYSRRSTNASDQNGTLWAAVVPLSTGEYFCVDSNGTAKINSSVVIWLSGGRRTC
jgi:prepilin-type N-terminal cleavage/methylation domain-containing protein